MKKSVIIGMLVAISFQMSFAQGQNIGQMRAKAKAHYTATLTRTKGLTAHQIDTLASVLDNHSKASKNELAAALNRTITAKGKNGPEEINLAKLGEELAAAHKTYKEMPDNTINPAEKKAMLEFIEASVDFMALAASTSDVLPKEALTADVQADLRVFYRQLSWIKLGLDEMDLSSLQSHTKAMKEASAQKKAGDYGDQAFAKSNGKGKDEAFYKAKTKKMDDC